jgi:[protein-PII] uridylyltransferase
MPHLNSQHVIVRTRLSPKGDGIQVMIYSQDRKQIFARICSFFDTMQYNIVQAQIYTTTHGYALDNFVILEPETRQVSYSGLLKHIEQGLTSQLADKQALTAPVRGRVNRQVKHMPIQTQIILHPLHATDSAASHQLDIITSDRPGLLALISQTLLQHQILLHNANINTLGNRVEDSFLISGDYGKMLDTERLLALKNAMSRL